MGRIFYIIGKSATGKDHIYRELLQEHDLRLFSLVLYTTRPMRKGEQDGREYHFVDAAQLEEFRKEGRIIEERVYETVCGPWVYFTADDGQIDLEKRNYLGIGTLESYEKLTAYFGREAIVPVYIETENALRLERARRREAKQAVPNYDELQRRFQADEEDFSEEKLAGAGITKRFYNNGSLDDCVEEIKNYIRGTL